MFTEQDWMPTRYSVTTYDPSAFYKVYHPPEPIEPMLCVPVYAETLVLLSGSPVVLFAHDSSAAFLWRQGCNGNKVVRLPLRERRTPNPEPSEKKTWRCPQCGWPLKRAYNGVFLPCETCIFGHAIERLRTPDPEPSEDNPDEAEA